MKDSLLKIYLEEYYMFDRTPLIQKWIDTEFKPTKELLKDLAITTHKSIAYWKNLTTQL